MGVPAGPPVRRAVLSDRSARAWGRDGAMAHHHRSSWARLEWPAGPAVSIVSVILAGRPAPSSSAGLPSARSGVLSDPALPLPKKPYNYSRPNLPRHFRTDSVRALDNTPEDNPVTDHG